MFRRSLPSVHLGLLAAALLPGVLAGCGGIGVRPNTSPDLRDAWRASLGVSSGLSPRTRQTLRQYALDQTWRDDPDQAAAALHERALRHPDPEILFALSEIHYDRGRRCERWDCTKAVGHYYLCAGYAYYFLFATARPGGDEGHPAALAPADAFDPRFRLACDLYNAGLDKCIRAAQHVGRLDPRHALNLPTPDGKGFLLSVNHIGFAWQPEEFGPLLPCDDFRVVGLENLHHSYGLGVPLIGTRAADAPVKHNYYPKEVSFPVTAFFRFEGGLAALGQQRVGQLELYNPLTLQTIEVHGHSVPLETDLTTPLAHFLSRSDLRSGVEYVGFLRVDQLLDREGIYMLQPYERGKIPVVLVHGLLSSPLTWAPLYNELLADPVLRARYQFWVYFYPTGNPYLATAADLRRSLEQLRDDMDPGHSDAALDQMVFVGHSMGGLVSKLLTVDSGDDFWNEVSRKPFEQLTLTPLARAELQPIFFFRRESCIKRVIFLGTPHHGSRLSPSLLGRLANRLVRLPKAFVEAADDLSKENPHLGEQVDLDRLTSVDLLAPGASALELLAAKPKPERVHYHSIVGVAPKGSAVVERWLGGGDVGDGVVPYASAHLDSADSEKVVPTDHFHVHQHPLAVLEVRRILHEHLKSVEPKPEIIPVKAEEAGRR
jgi:pimeloyl-ACP methyl ester carboxylesterase